MKKGLRQRVLVVDDQQVVRDILAHFLSKKGFGVETAENGLEALELFIDHHFDLVITDLQMPHMDGSALALEIKDRNPTTCIILMTGNREIGGNHLPTSSCADFALSKPFGLTELYEVVEFVLESEGHDRALHAALT